MVQNGKLISGLRTLLIVQAVVALVLALIPKPESGQVMLLVGADDPGAATIWLLKALYKLNHVIAFLIMAATGCLGYHAIRARMAWALFAYGLVIEALQTFTADRNAQWQDVLANGLGIVLGLGLGAWLMHWRGRRWGLV